MAPTEHDALAACDQRFADIDRRLDVIEKAEWRGEIKALSTEMATLRESLANLNGRIAGYLVAGGILGSLLSGLVQYVIKK